MTAGSRTKSDTWILEPSIQCVEFLAEALKINTVLQRSLIVLGGFKSFLTLTKESFSNSTRIASEVDKLLREQELNETWAKEICRNNFHQINVHSVVEIWTAIEVAVEDTISAILLNDATTLVKIGSTGYSNKILQNPAVDILQAKKVFSRWESYLRSTMTIGRAYEYMLELLLCFEPNETRAGVLTELNFVRNILLHRGGTVDNRVIDEAPELGLQPGQSIHLSPELLLRYHEFASSFASAMAGAATKSRYMFVEGERAS